MSRILAWLRRRFYAPDGELRRSRISLTVAITLALTGLGIAWLLHSRSLAIVDLVIITVYAIRRRGRERRRTEASKRRAKITDAKINRRTIWPSRVGPWLLTDEETGKIIETAKYEWRPHWYFNLSHWLKLGGGVAAFLVFVFASIAYSQLLIVAGIALVWAAWEAWWLYFHWWLDWWVYTDRRIFIVHGIRYLPRHGAPAIPLAHIRNAWHEITARGQIALTLSGGAADAPVYTLHVDSIVQHEEFIVVKGIPEPVANDVELSSAPLQSASGE